MPRWPRLIGPSCQTIWQCRLADRFTTFREEEAFVFPGAHDAIDALKARGVKLALVTNGAADTQRAKVERFALTHRFDHIQIEGEHGFGKPEERAYLHAMQALGVTAQDTWMVGDNLEWEVEAPQRLGIYAIWMDVHGEGLPAGSTVKPDRIIRSLAELVPVERDKFFRPPVREGARYKILRNADEIITTPPTITATSRMAV